MSNQSALDKLAMTVLKELITRDLTIAIAESCTGGLASAVLTDLDGCSEVLLFSIVAYSKDAKEEFLGLSPYIFREFGTISIECAKAMAEGLLSYEVDIGLATTGVVGEAIEDKLKGTAFIAVAVSNNETFAKELVLDPKESRSNLKKEIVKNLFEFLLEIIDFSF